MSHILAGAEIQGGGRGCDCSDFLSGRRWKQTFGGSVCLEVKAVLVPGAGAGAGAGEGETARAGELWLTPQCCWLTGEEAVEGLWGQRRLVSLDVGVSVGERDCEAGLP